MDNIFERITKQRTNLLQIMPFFGRLALYLKPRLATPEDKINSCAVSPDGIFAFNEEFLGKLTDEEIAGCLAHEVMHLALLFFDRSKGKVINIFNLAQDYCINSIIINNSNDSIVLPQGSVYNADFDDMTAEEIYEILMKNRKKSREKAVLVRDCRPNLEDDGTDLGDPEKIEENTKMWEQAVIEAANYHENTRGSLPLYIRRIIYQINEAKIDWKKQLIKFLGENGSRGDYSYRRPSRRSESVKEYLPTIIKTTPMVTLLLDTSGSITDEIMKNFIGEVSEICNELNMNIRVLINDSIIHEDTEINQVEDLLNKIKGGGGSSFIEAFDRLSKDNDRNIIIAFTDGDIDVPKSLPENLKEVVWVLPEGRKSPTDKYGLVIEMRD